MEMIKAIIDQYWAALEMLKQVITQCPAGRWNDPNSRKKFWQAAYHALYYTHLYLHTSMNDFKPWAKHRKEYRDPWPNPEVYEPCSREAMLEFLELCRQMVDINVSTQNLDAPSGFDWLPFSKLELQLYNMRHVQHHAAELIEWLGAIEGIEVDWVSTAPGPDPA